MHQIEVRYTVPYINGRYLTDEAGSTFESRSPCDGSKLCDIQECTQTLVDDAVEAARRALPVWNAKKAEEKSVILRKMADAIRKRNDWIANIETMDAGIPIATTRGHFADRSAAFFDYFSGMPDKLHGRTVPIDPAFMSMTVHEPIGVIGILVPWNAPFTELSLSVAAAIACGNTVVVKPASDTTLSALILGEICDEAGLDAGVINIVTGRGSTVGDYMARHPGIDKIAFTGGSETGKQVLRNSIDSLKGCTLELGGKAPVIVCEDADLDFAAAQASFSSVRNSGQICTAASRLFIQRSIYDNFLALIVEKMKSYQVGDPFDPKTVLGPMVSLHHQESVLRYIEKGKAGGATLLLGGDTPQSPALKDGYFVNPTLFADVDHHAVIAQEEIFGPVLCCFPFTTLEEAVALANDVKYGLAASIFTSGIRNSQYFLSHSQAGINWVNCINLSHPAISHGGYKESGLGVQNGMDAALYSYTRIKTIWINKNC